MFRGYLLVCDGRFCGKAVESGDVFCQGDLRRRRYNVLRVLNFRGKQITIVTNETYISVPQVILLIDRMLVDYKAGTGIGIGQCGISALDKVTEYVKEQGSGLIFLLSYSLNQALISRIKS
jgi:hypothetical protein